MFDVIINVHIYILNCIFYCTVLLLSLQAKDAMSVGLLASELLCKLGVWVVLNMGKNLNDQ